MQHVRRAQLFLEIAVHGGQQVIDLVLAHGDILGPSFIGHVGRADQSLVAFIGVDEDDPLVVVLDQIGLLARPPFRHDDVAALDQPDLAAGIGPGDIVDDIADPWPRAVDDAARTEAADLSRDLVAGLHGPGAILAAGGNAGAAGQDDGALFRRADRVQDHKAGVVHPAVAVFEPLVILVQQRRALGVAAQVQRAGAGQLLAPAQVVVKEQAQPDQPGRAILRRMGQHEAHRPDDVGGSVQQHLALDQGFADQAEFVIFQIAQAPVDQLARPGRRALRQVVLFAQHDFQTPARRVARHARAVDAAADDRGHGQCPFRDRAAARASHAGGKARREAAKAGNSAS